MIRIQRVTSNNDLKKFMRLPYQLHRDNSNWVSPLRVTQKKLFDFHTHPFWPDRMYRLFLAFRKSECVGRIGAFTCEKDQQHVNFDEGFFGFLEGIDDPEVFRLLLKEAVCFLGEAGCKKITGPFNPSLHYELGILVNGFDTPPYFMLTYNPEYYDGHVRSADFKKCHDFYAYRITVKQLTYTDSWKMINTYLKKQHDVSIRNPDMNNFDKELQYLYEIYNDAFEDHWGFNRLPWEQFHYLARDLKSIIDPRIVFIAEKGSEVIGFLLSLPNLNEILIENPSGKLFPKGLFKLLFQKKKIKQIRVITVAIKKKYQHLGIGSLLYPQLTQRALQIGYTHGELSWVSEDNRVMNRIARRLNADNYKTYRIYHKQL